MILWIETKKQFPQITQIAQNYADKHSESAKISEISEISGNRFNMTDFNISHFDKMALKELLANRDYQYVKELYIVLQGSVFRHS
jgi:hypothetical protein